MGEIVDLHTYFTTCPECGDFRWYIQWDAQCTEVIQIICANLECGRIIENPSFNNQSVEFIMEE